MQRVYRHELEVSEEAVDDNGHVNNIQYVRWMQDVAVLHSEESGCTRATRAVGATWVVRTHRIEYFRPAFAGDHIAVLTWVSDFRRVRSLRKYRFQRVSDKTVLAEGETDWVFVDVDTGRPRVIPETVAGAFTVLAKEEEPEWV
jgi:acyl-CoA thioester hydrolase